MSAKGELRDLTPAEDAEANARAYTASYLKGWGVVEVLDRMGDLMSDLIAAAERRDLDRARQLSYMIRAGLGIVAESLTANEIAVTVASTNPLFIGKPAT